MEGDVTEEIAQRQIMNRTVDHEEFYLWIPKYKALQSFKPENAVIWPYFLDWTVESLANGSGGDGNDIGKIIQGCRQDSG